MRKNKMKWWSLTVLCSFIINNTHGMSYDMLGYIPSPQELMTRAIEANNILAVAGLLEQHALKPEVFVDSIEGTPLHSAIKYGNAKMVEYLLQKSVFGSWGWLNYKMYGENLGTPFFYAKEKLRHNQSFIPILHQLLLHGTDIDQLNEGTMLWYMTNDGNFWEEERIDLISFLLRAGANKAITCTNRHTDEYCTNQGCTPYIRALKSKFYESAELISQEPVYTLLQRYKQENEDSFKEVLYRRSIFYEKNAYDLRQILKEVQRCKKQLGFSRYDANREMFAILVKSKHVERLLDLLGLGLSCDEAMTKKIVPIVRADYQNDPTRKAIVRDQSPSLQRLVKNLSCIAKYCMLRSLQQRSRDDIFSDVIIECGGDIWPQTHQSVETLKKATLGKKRKWTDH